MRTLTLLAGLTLLAAPLAAQDTTGTKRDTTSAKPVQDTTAKPVRDTTGVRRDSIVVAPDTTRHDTTGAPQAAPPVQVAPAPVAAPAPAPVTDNAVKPGMTEAEVVARWGNPIATRTANDWTYLFYRNGEERSWGYYDVVMLQRGQVMDAIVRSPDHPYAGESSSPEGRTPVFTPPHRQPSDSARGAAVTGVRVNPSP